MGHINDAERSAIDAWLAKNKPIKYPTGHSSIYDEFGQKRTTLKFRMSGIAKRIRSALKLEPTLTYSQLAEKLVLPLDDVKAVCQRHNIKVRK